MSFKSGALRIERHNTTLDASSGASCKSIGVQKAVTCISMKMTPGYTNQLRLCKSIRKRINVNNTSRRCLWSLGEGSNNSCCSNTNHRDRQHRLWNYPPDNLHVHDLNGVLLRWKSIFVSRHNNLLTKDDIVSYLSSRLGVSVRDGGLRVSTQVSFFFFFEYLEPYKR